jgi:hypothetical protein
MNKRTLITTILIAILFCTCAKVEKDVNNYFPKVKTKGVTLLPNGNVQVTGEIISEGNTSIVYAGFCMDTLPNPGMTSNQQRVDVIEGNTFTTTYTALEKKYTYYFRAWAANERGYAIGGDVSIDSVTMSPSLIPCSLPLDTMILETPTTTKKYKYTDISPIEQSTQEWEIELSNGQSTLEIIFSRRPGTGVYTIVGDNIDSKAFTAEVMLDYVRTGYKGEIYVMEIDASTVEVTICEMEWQDLYKRTLKTRFRTSYE